MSASYGSNRVIIMVLAFLKARTIRAQLALLAESSRIVKRVQNMLRVHDKSSASRPMAH